jgi:hypothetical protein
MLSGVEKDALSYNVCIKLGAFKKSFGTVVVIVKCPVGSIFQIPFIALLSGSWLLKLYHAEHTWTVDRHLA